MRLEEVCLQKTNPKNGISCWIRFVSDSTNEIVDINSLDSFQMCYVWDKLSEAH